MCGFEFPRESGSMRVRLHFRCCPSYIVSGIELGFLNRQLGMIGEKGEIVWKGLEQGIMRSELTPT